MGVIESVSARLMGEVVDADEVMVLVLSLELASTAEVVKVTNPEAILADGLASRMEGRGARISIRLGNIFLQNRRRSALAFFTIQQM